MDRGVFRSTVPFQVFQIYVSKTCSSVKTVLTLRRRFSFSLQVSEKCVHLCSSFVSMRFICVEIGSEAPFIQEFDGVLILLERHVHLYTHTRVYV